MHFEYIADAVESGLDACPARRWGSRRLGLLTVLTERQGMARAWFARGRSHTMARIGERLRWNLRVRGREWARGSIYNGTEQ